MYIQGDIHNVIKTLETNSIDLIYTNPPFGITECKWDTPLDWDNLWDDIWRVLKPNGIVALHASMPFTYTLIKSQTPKYHYSIKKTQKTGFLACKYQPLRNNEELFIYYKKTGTYNPQMIGDEVRVCKGYAGKCGYYDRVKKDLSNIKKTYIGRFPSTSIEMVTIGRGGKTISDDIIDYVIKTYSNEGETVLDMTTHNTLVGDRVKLLNRKFIGVDLLLISELSPIPTTS
jgi:site-specific DNA-methyltransferase (adenine-specific)